MPYATIHTHNHSFNVNTKDELYAALDDLTHNLIKYEVDYYSA